MVDESSAPPTPAKGSWRRKMAWLAVALALGNAIGQFGLAIVRGRGFDTAIAMTVVMSAVAALLWLAVRKLGD